MMENDNYIQYLTQLPTDTQYIPKVSKYEIIVTFSGLHTKQGNDN